VSILQFSYQHALAITLGLLSLTQGAGAQEARPSQLEVVSMRAGEYVNELADVTCTEHVSQEKLTPSGKMELHQESAFDYLIMMDGSRDEFSLNESRLPKQQGKTTKNLPLLVTNGFSTLFLVFHPYYRDSFVLTPEGEVIEDGQKLLRIRFEHIRGKRTPVALAVRGREYPLEITGYAWVEEESGAIARIEAGLSESMDDIGLRTLHMQVNYSPMKLAGAEHPFRYPSSAYVQVETRKQHWQNIHLFTNYKRFGVSTEVAVSEKKQ
jgi:hypothetical protein